MRNEGIAGTLRPAAWFLLLLGSAASAEAQHSNTQEAQETPAQAKAQAQKLDTKATDGDAAKRKNLTPEQRKNLMKSWQK
jgi:hypothetical protein